MPLKLFKVSKDLDTMRALALERARALQSMLPHAQEIFSAAGEKADLSDLARKKSDQGWDGALPTAEEPVTFRKSAPALEKGFTLIAVDGSQIYPDKHAAVQYYALNIGYFLLRTTTGQTEADSQPAMAIEEKDLYIGEHLISNQLVNARRSAAEMTSLYSLALREKERDADAPIVALLDGGIALRVDEAAVPPAERDALKKAYFGSVRGFTVAQIPFAGYVARPGGSPVMELARLAAEPSPANALLRVSDRMLFERLLGPGERSALFEFGTFWNRQYMQSAESREQSVHFFYMNAGSRYPVVARVEIPAWVAARPEWIDRIHAALLEQCSVTLSDPYPYALIRADEEAFVSAGEKAILDQEIAREFARHGILPRRSEKLSHKGRARRR
jgi:hypothetical protein